MANATFTKYCFRALRYLRVDFAVAVSKSGMAASGHKPKPAMTPGKSVARRIADLIAAKADTT